MKISANLFLLLASLLAGCTSESVPDSQPSAIVFSTEVSTRATTATGENMKEFGLYAFHTGEKKWEEGDVSTTAESGWIDHHKIKRLPGDLWEGNVANYYWPANPQEYLSFFAYSPYVTAGNDILSVPLNKGVTSHSKGTPWLEIEIPENASRQIDLLVANRQLNCSRATNGDGSIKFQFRHVLTRVAFSAYCLTQGVMMQSIAFTNLPYKGRLNSMDGSTATDWTIDQAVVREFKATFSGQPVSTDPTKPTDLSEPSKYFMLFARTPTVPSTLLMTVEYTLLGNRFRKSTTVEEVWERGKSIRYLLLLDGKQNSDLIVDKVSLEPWGFNDTPGGEQDAGAEIKTYTLNFDANGGTDTPTKIEAENGVIIRLPATVPQSPASSTFKEWNTKLDGTGTGYQPLSTIPLNADMTLYAQWQPI